MNNILELVKRSNAQDIFFNYQNGELSIEIEDNAEVGDILVEIKENKQGIISLFEKCRPLSFSQERLWFIDQYEHNASYNIPGAIKLIGKLDVTVLEKTFAEIIRRHEVLRTNFVTINDTPWQYVHEKSKFELTLIDQSHLDPKVDDQAIQDLIEFETQKPFDLEGESLIRLVLYRIDEDNHILFLNKHHIISDGWSFSVLIKEISILYQAFSEDKTSPLSDLSIQYADFAIWQREYMEGELLQNQSLYWKNKLEDVAILELATDRPRPVEQTFNGTNMHFSLDVGILQKLNALSKANDVTLFMTLLSIFKVLLSRYTGQEDICVGSPIANRRRKELEPLLGLFINTLALRSKVKEDLTFDEFLTLVKATTLEAYENQDIPFEKVVDAVHPERNLTYSPLFQVVMALQNNPVSELSFGDVNLQSVDFQMGVSKFDLTLNFTESAEGLFGVIEYNTDLFDNDRIERFIGHFKVLVDSILSNPSARISDLEILSLQEKNQLLIQWNDTDTAYPMDKCIHQLFEEQVENTPHNVAAVCEGKELTYRQLNEMSNQFSHYIASHYTTGTNVLIGVKLDRSIEMLVSILGILKSGSAYVPINPGYPQERIDYMVSDSGCEILIDMDEYSKFKEEQSSFSDSNIDISVEASDLCYVIYTSGSTGYPKGVMIEHSSVVRLVKNNDYISLSAEDNVLSLSTFVFDGSIFDIFGSLLNGSSLIIPTRDEVIDFSKLNDLIEKKKVSVFFITTALFNSLVDSDDFTLESVRTIMFGGELVSVPHVEKFRDRYSTIELLHVYGPTENTTFSTYHRVADSDINKPTIPIGIPISNSTAYILGTHNRVQPMGVVGEICLGGAGLARGYLNNDELTSEKFIPHFIKEGERLYKTGDLGRWTSDGTIEFVGRADDQVKIRGFRIELGEIETVINQQEEVSDNVVLVKEDRFGNKQLVAYVSPSKTSGEHDIIDIDLLKSRLSKTLPEYMVPSLFVTLESMPLNRNGKIDKKALPEPAVKVEDDHMAPSTEIEDRVVGIWADVLGIDKHLIGIHKSFFEIGGNSLLSIKLQKKLSQLDEFKNIHVADLFKYYTVRMLVQSIKPDVSPVYNLQKGIQANAQEIAIIGMSGAFSGAKDIAEFWKLIKNQEEGVRSYSKEECEDLGADLSLFQNPNYIPVAGQVKGVDQFDPMFWDLSPNDAKLLDPQIRKFLEHCWYVLESSGYIHLRKDSNIGVFAGSGNNAYFFKNVLNGEKSAQFSIWEASIANSKDALTTKASYMLGLSGPANSINTACSTGLISVIEACKNLQLGTCEMALAGGVSLVEPKEIGYTYQDGMILSKDGHCRTFDEKASGTVGGSGVGVVMLKRLNDAIEDNDNIIGIIKGYASNNDGDRKTDYTAPSVTGQAECIINAQKMAGLSSSDIDFIECHGTATHLGDPIEVQALKEAFEFNNKETELNHKTVLGAVKANIGHTNSAAGTAGLIKACLMLQNNIIPGQPNFDIPNPKLNIDQTCFEISKENREWAPSSSRQRTVGISSFGIGGTNAHVIIGDYIADNKSVAANNTSNSPAKEELSKAIDYVVPISAKSKASLELYRQQLIEYLEGDDVDRSIEDIAFSLQEKREHFNYRSAYCASSIVELIDNLNQQQSTRQVHTETRNKLVFMFPGQGAQYPGMAQELYENEPHFQATIDRLISLANVHVDIDLFEVIFPEKGNVQFDISETRWAQIALFIVEYALAEFIESLGIKPDAYLGHSIGEYVAATLSGVFSLEDAVKVVIARGKLMQSMPAGSMLAIKGQVDEIHKTVVTHNCEVAVINSIEDIAASGSDDDINALKEALDKQSIPSVILNTSHAYHSKMMEDASTDFEDVFSKIKLNKPSKYFASNLSGEIANEEVSTAAYWSKQLRSPVQFAKCIQSLTERFKYKVDFIEVGPGRGLSSFVSKYNNANSNKAIQSVPLLPSKKQNSQTNKLKNKEGILAALWASGIVEKPNNINLFHHQKTLTNLPSYQFDFKKCWLEPGTPQIAREYNPIEDIYYKRTWERVDQSITNEHRVNLKSKNIVVLINENSTESHTRDDLIKSLNKNCENVGYVVHQQDNNIISDFTFDLVKASHANKIFNEKVKSEPIDMVIYYSPTIDLDNPCLDIFAIRNIFDWAFKTQNKIPQFISITHDNYEVVGNEVLQQKPSIVSGVTKSIPFEYFSMDTHALHIDLSSSDPNNMELLISSLGHNQDEELIALRGKYNWAPRYQHVDLAKKNSEQKEIEQADKPAFLITGGLGGVGYAYAEYLANNENVSTIILLGRTMKSDLNEDNKAKLENLSKSKHQIIYASVDIGSKAAARSILKILSEYGITTIQEILHSAGVAAKSALNDKTKDEISQVVIPKILGIENLLTLTDSIKVDYLISCSSLASMMPSIGQMEYTAANLYLDELSHRIHPNVKYMLTINLNQISDTGMAVDFINENTSKIGESDNAIRSNEFPVVLEKLLHSKTIHNTLISRFAVNQMLSDNIHLLKEINKKEISASSVIITENNYSDTEFKIAQIWNQVLGVEEVGRNDNFFELGGSSLHAMQVVAKIRTEFNAEMPLSSLSENPELSSISKIIEAAKSENVLHEAESDISKNTSGTDIDIEQLPTIVFREYDRYKPFPLTAVQQSYWIGRNTLYDLGGVGTHAYSESYIEEFDVERFNQAINCMIRRHEMLRMVVTEDGQQRILENVEPFEIQVLDLRGSTQEEEKHKFMSLRDELSHQLYSGHVWPLFDVRVCIFRDGTYKLLFSMDGLVFDASSSGIFMNEIISFYEVDNYEPPKLSISFRDYVLAEQSLKNTQLYKNSKQYWLDRIDTIPKTPELPLAKLPSEITDVKFSKQRFQLSRSKWGVLKDKISASGVTPTVFIIQCFSEIMYRWSKLDHFTLNLTLYNRLPFHEEVNSILGDFTSISILEIDYRDTKDFQARLKDTQSQLWNDLEHRYYSGIEVARKLSRSAGYTVTMPIVVTSTLGIEFNEDIGAQEETIPQVELSEIKQPYSITQTPQVWIDCQITERRGALQIDWDSVKELFPEGMLEDMFGAFEKLLNGFVEDQNQWTSPRFDLLPLPQLATQSAANETSKKFPDKLLHELFIDQVKIQGDKAAIRTSTKTIGYHELYQRSAQLGAELMAKGAKPNELIAIVMHKGWEQVVSAIGIQFSGAAYLPIEASLPEQRILNLLEIGEVNTVVSLSSILDGFSLPDAIHVLKLDEMQYDNTKEVKKIAHQKTSDLAYVIFTSGSTGVPKGVMIDHQGAVNTILDINERFGITHEDICFAISSLSFDLSVYDVFGVLAVGGTLVIPNPTEQKDPEAWERYVEEESITIWNSVPAQMQMLVDYNTGNNRLASLKNVLLSGDWIPVNLPDKIKNLCPEVEVTSLGGATEASIWSIYYPIKEVGDDWKSIPYGKPLSNQSFHVLKPDLTPCPQWVPGDLYIGGKGLALGYWRDKKKTKSSFIIHSENGERLYKTGDIGRYLPDGNIEFLGRNDDQVKIRGFRIELGEIESALNQQAEVNSSVVLALGERSGTKQLVAYVIPTNKTGENEGLDIEKMREELSKTLPDYMVPSLFVKLDKMPLTPNGKVNKRALPEPEGNLQMTNEYVAPETEKEKKLVAIWQDLLEVEKIGIHDNFFELGGHSLLVTRVISKIKTEFNSVLPLQILFENNTIYELSKQIDAGKINEKSAIRIQKFNKVDKASEADFEEIEF